mmetsp:Transcript_87190/g.154411  ORF Transcript_87190/g.154411 Transcript_87190/m.154411 type:complete len:903 (+) Transcript_87190:81-2789(+)
MAMEVLSLDLPEELLAQLIPAESKAPPKPGDKLQNFPNLSIHHALQAAEAEQQGHARTEKRFEPLKLAPSSSAEVATRELRSERTSSSTRKYQGLSPIDAARAAAQAKEGSGVKSARTSRGRRRDAASQPPLPRHSEVAQGWSSLLTEIATSSRRVRLAKGGQLTGRLTVEKTGTGAASGSESDGEGSQSRPSKPPSPSRSLQAEAARSQAATPRDGKAKGDAEDEDEEDIWLSYHINEEKVPDSVLAALWRHAVDPKNNNEDAAQAMLEKVPRLSVTRREVQPLPAVHDISHWRQANKRRREQRKARRDAERNPGLAEMLDKIFGEHEPAEITAHETQLKKRIAAEAVAAAIEELNSPIVLAQASSLQRQAMKEELELLQAIEALITEEAENAMEEVEASRAQRGPLVVGTQRRGRRGGFDEGRASAKAAGAALAELQRREDKTLVQSTKLRKGVDASRALAAQPGCADHVVQAHLKQVKDCSVSVVRRCEARVRRLREMFIRRQGVLSDRLQRRVKRIQIDHAEIHDMKERSILPSVVTREQAARAANNSKFPVSVLQYLKPHRVTVERARLGRHASYTRQVERFQKHLRSLADPNREPDRAEIYLSQCFRHVLAAGLAVDSAFFFRVLTQMEPLDFEKAASVNMVAACCDAFEISAAEYVAFLDELEFPRLVPIACATKAVSHDSDAWDGVELVPMASQEAVDGAARFEAPLPLYPVLPADTPRTSELASRDDPMQDILEASSFDLVLERYNAGAGIAAILLAAITSSTQSDDGDLEEDTASNQEMMRSFGGKTTSKTSSVELQPPTSLPTEEEASRASSRPPRPPLQSASPPVSRKMPYSKQPFRGNRPFVPKGHATLRSTRAVAEPMSQIASARLPAKTKAEAGKAALRAVREVAED